eukprot:7235056-Alexandrium_andersonii.AAC.1
MLRYCDVPAGSESATSKHFSRISPDTTRRTSRNSIQPLSRGSPKAVRMLSRGSGCCPEALRRLR